MLRKKTQASLNNANELYFLATAVCTDVVVLLMYFAGHLNSGYYHEYSSKNFLLDCLQDSIIDAIPILIYLKVIEIFLLVLYFCWKIMNNSRGRNNLFFNEKHNGVDTLNKYIEYNKKRYEIDSEINRLYSDLMRSDISQFVDANRLAFIGQQSLGNISGFANDSINYDKFLSQFGISKEDATIREGSAAFLTPFTLNGNQLFEVCQTILGRIGILLRKTDNLVEKDDILMNIVSLIVRSEFVLVNIDGRNPNVYYELGIAHAIGKPTILLSKYDCNSNELNSDVGFDIRQKRIIIYKDNDDLEKQLLGQISMLTKVK